MGGESPVVVDVAPEAVGEEEGRLGPARLKRDEEGAILFGRRRQPAGQPFDGRRRHQGGGRGRPAEPLAHDREHVGRRERVAPQFEKVVPHADGADAEYLLPDEPQPLFGVVSRREEWLRQVRPPPAGAGSARMSTFPLCVSGSSAKATKAEGIM